MIRHRSPPSCLGTRKQPLSFPASKLPFTTPAAPETPFLPTPTSSIRSREKRKVPGSSHSKASGSRFDRGDGVDNTPDPTDGGDGDDWVDDSLSHSPVSKGGETTSPVPDISPVRRGSSRNIAHSDINLADTSLSALTSFPINLVNFERENDCRWDRNFFNRKLLYTLKSRWSAWREAPLGVSYLTSNSQPRVSRA